MGAAPSHEGFPSLPLVLAGIHPPPPTIAPNAIISSQEVQAHEVYYEQLQALQEVPQAAKDAAWGRLNSVHHAYTAQYVEATVHLAGPGDVVVPADIEEQLQVMTHIQAVLVLPQQMQDLQEQVQALQGLPQQMQNLQEQMQGLSELPQQMQTLHEQMQGLLELPQQMQDLHEQMQGLLELPQQMQDLQGLPQHVQGLAQQVQGLLQQVQAPQGPAQQVQGLQGLQQEVQGLAQQMQGLPQLVQGLAQQIQGPAQQVWGLEGLQQQVQGLQQQMQALQGLPQQMQALQGLPLQVQGLQQEVQALRLRINNLEINTSIRLRNSVEAGPHVQWVMNAQGNCPQQPPRTRAQLRKLNKAQVDSYLNFYGLPILPSLQQKRASLMTHLGVFEHE